MTKVFGRGSEQVRAVDSASLTVAAGEIVLVMEPSGAGKTTLLAMCGALLSPTAGRIWVGQTEVTALSEKERPALRLRQIGFIFQAANLLANLTALENVRVVMDAAGASRRQANARARELLGELRLGDRVEALPVVAVTHDQRIEDVADRVLWLEDGHLSNTSPVDATLARPV